MKIKEILVNLSEDTRLKVSIGGNVRVEKLLDSVWVQETDFNESQSQEFRQLTAHSVKIMEQAWLKNDFAPNSN